MVDRQEAGRGAGQALACDVDPHHVLDGLGDIVLVLGRDGVIRWANCAAEQVLGWPRMEWVGRSALDLIHPDDLRLATVSLETLSGRDGPGSLIDLRVTDADGRWRYLEVRGAPLGDDRFALVLRDVTDRRSHELAAGDDPRFRAMVHFSAAVTMLLDDQGNVITANGTVTRLLGLDPELLCGTPLRQWVLPESAARLDHDLTRVLSAPRSVVETVFAGTRAQPVHVEFRTVNLLDDPVVRGVILSGHDVTQLVEAREALKHLASHDTLTGLANRASLADYLGHLLADEAMAEQTGVVFIDLDRFKPVNDLYGHDAGDRLLVEVAARLREVVRPTDLVARFGGDEFVVVATNLPNLGSVAALAARIERGLNGAVALGRASVPVQVSIGYALARAGATAGNLIGEADAAMYAVKEARRGTPPHVSFPETRRWVADELPRAIEDRQLVVHFQPVVAVADSRVAGYEALVRWEHPSRGLLEPSLFLPVAEEIGVAPALGDRVLEAAVRFISLCNERVVEPRWVSVNLTASQFHDPLLPSMIRRHVTAAGLDPGLLRLEVSEAMALDRSADGTSTSTESSISSLEQLGVRLVLDDFGTGYASLLQLCRLPAVALKIDRSFISELQPGRADDVVASMIQIGAVLGLEVVAEGVERPEQMDALAELGCPYAQGFLLGRPVPSPLPG